MDFTWEAVCEAKGIKLGKALDYCLNLATVSPGSLAFSGLKENVGSAPRTPKWPTFYILAMVRPSEQRTVFPALGRKRPVRIVRVLRYVWSHEIEMAELPRRAKFENVMAVG